MGRSREALREYETSLQRAPKRLAGLYGAAEAAKLAGEPKKANAYFAELAKVTEKGDGTRPEIKQARSLAAR
jgi:uncharacterized protein HemY